MKLTRLRLQDEGQLKAYVKGPGFSTIKQRKNFLRSWRGQIWLWEDALLCLERSWQGCGGSRLYILSAHCYPNEDIASLIREIFRQVPDLFDLTVILPPGQPAPTLPPPYLPGRYYGQFPTGTVVEQTTVYAKRLELFCPQIYVPHDQWSIVVTCSPQADAICHVTFLRSGDQISDLPTLYLLSSLQLLDEKACFRSQETPNEPALAYPPLLIEAKRQILAYLAGERKAAFDLPLDLAQGTDFQQKVWQALRHIPYGVAVSYRELAGEILDDQAAASNYARAVGNACALNPLPLLVPCHRVIGSAGDLVGFSGGVDIKANLLDMELLRYHKG